MLVEVSVTVTVREPTDASRTPRWGDGPWTCTEHAAVLAGTGREVTEAAEQAAQALTQRLQRTVAGRFTGPGVPHTAPLDGGARTPQPKDEQ